ncbi:hypothetical protein [Aquabacter cavernae]|uniref:hypothetical protein n=1 Tax=Aquabacter cavernae TaxID=2496029 RepID=UPI000F8D9EDB|nr:hypothetical protein [Aquabacter cavernae]
MTFRLAARIMMALAAALSPAHADPVPSYCRADETTLFSCDFGSHTASVCAAKDVVQYRFGHLDRVLTTYPAPGTKAADAFTVGTLAFSGGGGAWLRFTDAGTRTTVFTATGKWGAKGGQHEVAGVTLEQAGQQTVTLACRGKVISELGPAFFDQAGLRAEGDFEIPDDVLPK